MRWVPVAVPKAVPVWALGDPAPLVMARFCGPSTWMTPRMMPVPRMSEVAKGAAFASVVWKETVANWKPVASGSKRTEKGVLCPGWSMWAGWRTTVNSDALVPEMVMKPCEPGASVMAWELVFVMVKTRVLVPPLTSMPAKLVPSGTPGEVSPKATATPRPFTAKDVTPTSRFELVRPRS